MLKRRGKLRLQQQWDCGYCDYAGMACHPYSTVYKGGDWLATVQSGTVAELRTDKNLRGYDAVDVEWKLNRSGYTVAPKATEQVE